jgi:putative endonuclease
MFRLISYLEKYQFYRAAFAYRRLLAVSLHNREPLMKEKQNITYILRCSDGTLYTGWTNHLDKRVKDHNAGRGARYTRGRGPVELAYQEKYDTKQEAMQREAQIKKMTRKEKEKLIEAYQKEKRN